MSNFNVEVNIHPDRGLKTDQKPRILSVSYGDGYVQRTADGINNLPEKWQLTWKNRPAVEANKIVLFFERRGGVEPFNWYPVGQDITGTTTHQYSGGLVDVNQVFTERYIGLVSELSESTVIGIGDYYDSATTTTYYGAVLKLGGPATLSDAGLNYSIVPDKRYVCEKWSVQEDISGYRTVTAEFIRVFEP